MRLKIFLLPSFLLFFVFYGHCQEGRIVFQDSSFISTVLQHHNTYRRALQLPDLQWSAALAADALTWAKHLAVRKARTSGGERRMLFHIV
jgi:uncharacterized protein YkwD